MRRLPLVLTLALAAAAAGSAVGTAPARASCAAVIVWHDAPYFAYATSGPRPRPVPGQRVRKAVQPSCNDTGGGPGPPTAVGARSIAGDVSLADVRSSSPVRLFDHRLFVFVDVHTRFAGLDRNGLPFVGWGQALRIDAVR